jgi:hypothetical protein
VKRSIVDALEADESFFRVWECSAPGEVDLRELDVFALTLR